MFIYVCMYVCMFVCMFACVYNFHMKLKYPCCCFAEAPALQHLFFFKKTLSFMMFDLTHCHSSQLDSPAKVGGEFGRSLVPLSLGDFSAVVRAGDRQRGMGKNVGGVPAHQYVNQVKFVERYGTKMSGSSQKYKLLLLIVFQCKQSILIQFITCVDVGKNSHLDLCTFSMFKP